MIFVKGYICSYVCVLGIVSEDLVCLYEVIIGCDKLKFVIIIELFKIGFKGGFILIVFVVLIVVVVLVMFFYVIEDSLGVAEWINLD